jgi:hypothetical protein
MVPERSMRGFSKVDIAQEDVEYRACIVLIGTNS